MPIWMEKTFSSGRVHCSCLIDIAFAQLELKSSGSVRSGSSPIAVGSVGITMPPI